MVRKAGPGALMAKSDIESAFWLLPVHPDCYHLLGAMFEDKYYFDTCLPMGCSISCHYFEMFGTFLEWVARKVARLPSITHYLDDFLFVGLANSEVCHYALAQFKDVMSCFGVPLSSEKNIGPVSVITFLGIEIDSVAMEFRLPQDKISKLQELIAGCLAVGKVTLVQMQSLLGSLNFACKVMPMGRIFSRRLILATKGVKQPHHRIRITAQLRSDLIIWQRFLFSYNGRTCFQENECDSDSLGLRLGKVDAVGFSISFREQTCADTWPESWVTRAWTQDSVLLELLPLAVAMELWGQFLANKRVCLRLKSDKATHALNFLSSSSLPVIKVIGFTVLKCLENNTWLKAIAHSVSVLWMLNFVLIHRCGMVSSRGNSSKFGDARIRSGMPWRADSFVKVFHRSCHMESIRWYATQHMAGGPFLYILGSTACGVMPRRLFSWPYRDGRHLAWNKRFNMVTSPAGDCANRKSSILTYSGGYPCRWE
ncbi:uncharacterized protein [Ranitomeya imitator]|uniref:uncharacterized protein n=1 Tax=Ranitomeya imitator TaxID=111125 RepID=UPI0037E8F4A9